MQGSQGSSLLLLPAPQKWQLIRGLSRISSCSNWPQLCLHAVLFSPLCFFAFLPGEDLCPGSSTPVKTRCQPVSPGAEPLVTTFCWPKQSQCPPNPRAEEPETPLCHSGAGGGGWWQVHYPPPPVRKPYLPSLQGTVPSFQSALGSSI